MKWSIIYSCDILQGVDLIAPPPSQSHLWDCTERSGGHDGAQLDWGVDGYRWRRGRHRKYCAFLESRQQFEDFLDHTGLYPEDVETMGSLGAPGFGYGHAPAISFHSDADDMIQSAYVTPVPSFNPTRFNPDEHLPGMADLVQAQAEAWQGRCWDRIRQAVLAVYS